MNALSGEEAAARIRSMIGCLLCDRPLVSTRVLRAFTEIEGDLAKHLGDKGFLLICAEEVRNRRLKSAIACAVGGEICLLPIESTDLDSLAEKIEPSPLMTFSNAIISGIVEWGESEELAGCPSFKENEALRLMRELAEAIPGSEFSFGLGNLVIERELLLTVRVAIAAFLALRGVDRREDAVSFMAILGSILAGAVPLVRDRQFWKVLVR